MTNYPHSTTEPASARREDQKEHKIIERDVHALTHVSGRLHSKVKHLGCGENINISQDDISQGIPSDMMAFFFFLS